LMKHVGNDVVDLKAPFAIKRSRDTRFVQRVLGAAEVESVLASDQPDSLLWAFWAAKETSYKVVSKSYPGVSSAPRRYPVCMSTERTGDGASGIVHTPCGTIPVKWLFADDYVHCIGADAEDSPAAGRPDRIESRLSRIEFGLRRIDTRRESGSRSGQEEESIQVRRHAAAHIASHLSRDPDDIRIMRANGRGGWGPPVACVEDDPDEIDVSLSHDGRFLAYAFLPLS
jgi:phosphopantetheinyl transferase (holo-ACP synthase)